MELLLLVIILILVGALVMLVRSQKKLTQEFERLKREDHRMHSRAYHQANKLVDEAREQSMELLTESEQKAQGIIHDSQVVTDEARKAVSETVAQLSQEQKVAFQKMLDTAAQNTSQVIAQLPAQIQASAAKETSSFYAALQEQLKASQVQLQEKMTANVSAATDEFAKTRVALRQKLQQSLFDTVNTVAQETIHKSLTRAEHEKLVMEAFQEISE